MTSRTGTTAGSGSTAGAERLSRSTTGRPSPPVRLAHLGLGNFFRAHQASYTDRAPDAAEWGIAAFTGRSRGLAEQMTQQDGLYTLVEQTADGNRCSVVSSVVQASAGTDVSGWVHLLAHESTAVVTLTVTEAAYLRTETGDADLARPELAADLEALRRHDFDAVHTVPGRLVAGLAARYDAGGAPLAVLPCDNLLHNGSAVRRVLLTVAEQVDADLSQWLRTSVSFVDSVVDRITPRATDADREAVRAATGLVDACPVVTEPFSEWVLGGDFPRGRPGWEHAGAQLTGDVTPFEQRKLWMLNGAHSQLAYAGSVLGHATVAETMADDRCVEWVRRWWSETAPHLDLPEDSLRTYGADLLARFANPGIRHLLSQIASDGSQKLAVRVLPVIRSERKAGRVPLSGARTLAAWTLHLRGLGAPVEDPRAAELSGLAAGRLRDAVPRVLGSLDVDLPDDADVVGAVLDQAEELQR